jgi:hypothetical protein
MFRALFWIWRLSCCHYFFTTHQPARVPLDVAVRSCSPSYCYATHGGITSHNFSRKHQAASIGTKTTRQQQLPELPWSMSEGIQGKKDREQLEQQIKIDSEGSSSGTAHRLRTTDSSSSSIRASKPQVGALLVEAYGKIVPKQRGFSADKVLFEYAKFLVSPINDFMLQILLPCLFCLPPSSLSLSLIQQVNLLEEEKKSIQTEKEAFALLDVVELAFRGSRPTWDPAFIHSIVAILQSHPVRFHFPSPPVEAN